MKYIILTVILFLISGCGNFTGFFNERSAGSVVEPGERLIIKSKRADGNYFPEMLICSEPPPDVATNVFSAISASLKGSQDDKIKAEAALESLTKEDNLKLFERSQGIQGLRDGMFRTCEAFINGGISPDVYGKQMTYMTATLNFLVVVELCGNILKSSELISESIDGDSDGVRGGATKTDKRAELYEGCMKTAEGFAKAILDAGNSLDSEIKPNPDIFKDIVE